MRREDLDARYPSMYHRLGTVPDAEIAEEYGLTASRVSQIRNDLGIPPAGSRRMPTTADWERLLAGGGEVVISTDRLSITVDGTPYRGRTLRQALLMALASRR